MTLSLFEIAHAKINLFLQVTGKRPDGYHLLESLAVFAEAGDRLTARPVDGNPGDVRLVLTGPFGAGLDADRSDNLILRAARAVVSASGDQANRFPALEITLEKNLPIASGIGGGSADAAAALRLMQRLWAPSSVDWHAIATSLGADVPVCVEERPALMRGIGDILTPAPPMPDCGMILVNCGQAVSTPEVFRKRKGTFTVSSALPETWNDIDSIISYLLETTNDLQDAAVEVCPAISTVISCLACLPNVRFARMSGSGATCFALFDTPDEAIASARVLQRGEGWWVWAGGLYTKGAS